MTKCYRFKFQTSVIIIRIKIEKNKLNSLPIIMVLSHASISNYLWLKKKYDETIPSKLLFLNFNCCRQVQGFRVWFWISIARERFSIFPILETSQKPSEEKFWDPKLSISCVEPPQWYFYQLENWGLNSDEIFLFLNDLRWLMNILTNIESRRDEREYRKNPSTTAVDKYWRMV